MNTLIKTGFFYAIVFQLVTAFPAYAQTPAKPTVTSPVNLCLGVAATALTATGSNLQWVSPITTTVGSNARTDGSSVYIADDTNNNRKTHFTTSVANVVLTSVDFVIASWQKVNNIQISIYNSNGIILATSSKIKEDPGANGMIITVPFNYTLSAAGNYSIGVSAGSGQVSYVDYSSPISSPAVTINGTLDGKRVFGNFNYSANVTTSTAPVPSTAIAGSYNYYVTQTVNGKTSAASTIVVNVNSTAAPTVTTPINLCQGATAIALSATGSNLVWTSSTSSSVGGTALFSEGKYIEDKTGNNRYTIFKTLVANVTIRSVDYIIPAYQTVDKDFQIGLYSSAGVLLATSSTITNTSAGSLPLKITNLFNYTITTPGEYKIGGVEGKGTLGSESSTYPITDPTGSVAITGVSNATYRMFNNIQFTVNGSSVSNAPTPSTAIGGTTTYYVTQTIDGCVSPAAAIVVNVNGVTSITPGVTTCIGSPVTLQATASQGYTLNWYSAASGGSSIATGTSYTTPNLALSTTYYVSATNGSCTTSRVPVQALVGGYVWTGNSNSESATPGNWGACGVNAVPPNTANVTIPETVNKLVLSADLTVNNLILQGNTKIYLNGKTLTVSSVSGTGTIVGSPTSKLILNATADVTLRFDQTTLGTTNALQELAINNNSRTVILENPLLITEVVKITGSSVLHSNGNLTLNSTATSNGNIGPLTGGGSIIGNVRVQTFLSGSAAAYRAFRTISPPVHDVTSPSKGYKVAGYKSTMYVTGAGGEANGFDASPSNGATIKYYNEPQKASQNQYLYPANAITEYITQGKGIYFYYRGKKDNTAGNKFVKVNGAFGTPEDVTMEYYGIINSGDISPAITYTNNTGDASSNGFNLIGNPYPSVIDWNSGATGIVKTRIENKIWIQRQNGAFAVYDGTTGTNDGSQFILPGQGFFIKANGPSPVITFKEAAKVTSAPSNRLLNVQTNERLSLAGTDAGIQTQVSNLSFSKTSITLVKDEFSTDETVIVFKDATSIDYDDNDMSYLGEAAVTLTSITPDSKYLAINYMPEPKDVTSIKLYTTAAESGDYSLKLSDYNSVTNTSVFLKDNELNKIIDLQNEPVYQFTIDKAVASSFGSARFEVMFAPPTTLPVSLSSFSVKKMNNLAQLSWKTVSEQNNSYFEVEQSVDGKTFYMLGTVKGANNSSSALNYKFEDAKPVNAINYYRLKQINTNGLYTYSKIIAIDFSLNTSNDNTIIIYPNPTVNTINVNIQDSKADDYKLNVFSLNGTKLLSGKGTELDVTLLSAGIYMVEVIDSNGKLLGNNKFIKK